MLTSLDRLSFDLHKADYPTHWKLPAWRWKKVKQQLEDTGTSFSYTKNSFIWLGCVIQKKDS